MAKRVLVKDLQAEIEHVKDHLRMLIETKRSMVDRIKEMDTELSEAWGESDKNERKSLGLESQVEKLQADYDICDNEYEEQRLKNIRLIKKLEANEAILDTIAHAATAGLAVAAL